MVEVELLNGCPDHAVHHNMDLFGPDEDAYRPERWILTSEGGDELSAEKLKDMERNNDMVFGSGRYQCLGKNVALIELNKAIFELLGTLPSELTTSNIFTCELQIDSSLRWSILRRP